MSEEFFDAGQNPNLETVATKGMSTQEALNILRLNRLSGFILSFLASCLLMLVMAYVHITGMSELREEIRQDRIQWGAQKKELEQKIVSQEDVSQALWDQTNLSLRRDIDLLVGATNVNIHLLRLKYYVEASEKGWGPYGSFSDFYIRNSGDAYVKGASRSEVLDLAKRLGLAKNFDAVESIKYELDRIDKERSKKKKQ